MRRLLALVFLVAASGAFAQAPPKQKLEPLPEAGPPPAGAHDVAPAQGGVTIRPGEQGPRVEEVRQGGRLVALKVTPKDGVPYYLVNTGEGNWVRRDSLHGISVPQWPIKTWQ